MKTDSEIVDGPTRDLPDVIVRRVLHQQKAMGWPDKVPAYVELPSNKQGKVLWCHWADLTVGRCEQLVEYHVRKARYRLQRWGKIGCNECKLWQYTREIAYHILRARLFRCTYISLIGQEDSTEADMPFAHNKW